jgi:hypothetical protein
MRFKRETEYRSHSYWTTLYVLNDRTEEWIIIDYFITSTAWGSKVFSKLNAYRYSRKSAIKKKVESEFNI